MECIDVVEGLSQKEQNKILSVLQRDANLRIGQEKKISDLKKEIQKMRMVGVLRAGDNQDKMCIRCRGDFGFLFNRGTLCPLCRFKVCNSCQQVMFNGSWLCIMCYKQRQLKWLTGEWKSFDQNPLRKWASGTDLVRASFQLVAGGSIDIDEDPDHGSSNNNQTRKPARNGVPVHDTNSKSRVEYPKDGDQHKLSQLFGVLRSKKPADDIAPEHQIKRVSSRRYSESDSDSSSCSDGDVASSIRSSESPNALSMTESELDARRLDSPRGVDSPSPRGQGVNGSRSSDFQNTLSPADREYRPKAAPRSPKPQRRPSQNEAYILDSSKVVRPKTRPPRKPDRLLAPEGQVSGRENVNVEDDSKVIMSKSMDINLGGEQHSVEGELERKAVSQTELNLQRHVARTKESLDRKKQEKQKSKSQNNIDNLTKNKSELEVEGNKLFRRSAENIIEHLPKHSDMSSVAKQTRTSDNQLDLKGNSNGMNQNTFKTEAEITNQRQNSKDTTSSLYSNDSELDANGNRKDVGKMTNEDIVSNTKHAKDDSQSKQSIQSKEDEGLFAFPAPRSGSPYSFSMDSLPSSHPSPTMRHSSIVSDSSIPESSDTDSLSRLSHPELGHLSEYSETESNIPDGAEDEFTVEEISNVRFQRVSKKVAQLGVMSKITKSPNRKKLLANRESPQTISECSISQDDSGNVSGGSRGTTPEHKRTDSSYSQSSIPSTLSTVTDKSEEEEDIDKVVKLHTQYGSRGNLLSVITDSRESIASYYSDAGDIAYSNIPVTGEILFAVKYNYKTAMLEVTVKQCKDIAIADTRRNKTDPYVKTYLLPDKTRNGKRKTKVKKHTTSPTFEETLRYSISKSELENRTLWVTVWHNDRFGRNSFLGEVTINFDYYKFDDTTPKWYILQERVDSQPSSMLIYKGDISVCIRYVTADKVNTSPTNKGKQKKDSGARGQLEVMVKEARNLTAVRSNGFSDPFCKGYLLPERHKSSKQKTAVIKKDCNPVWNHTFIFEDVSLMELRERCLELTIWDYEKISSNDFLGGVRLNLGTGMSQGKATEWMDARGEEMSMWQAMLDRPNLWIDGALILRPNMEKRKY